MSCSTISVRRRPWTNRHAELLLRRTVIRRRGLFAEVQPNAWMIDGGVPLVALYGLVLLVTLIGDLEIDLSLADPEDRLIATIVVAANVGTLGLVFTFVPFGTAVGMQFWFLEGMLRGAMADRPRNDQMTWLIVAGDLTPLGGMDAANHALARYLASRDEVHVVTHRAWPDLAAFPNVTVHRVWRPLNRHLLGSPLLSRTGQRVWRRLRSSSARAIVNGGNCRIAGVNWVHYLHAAHPLSSAGSFSRRAKVALTHRRDLTAERAALRAAQVVICNSRRTRDDVIERIGVDPSPPARHLLRRRSGPFFSGERRGAGGGQGGAGAAGRPAARRVRRRARRSPEGVRHGVQRVARAVPVPGVGRRFDRGGPGGELPAWRRRAREAGVGDRIRFAGFRTDVPQILAALDALVHPARYEAYGLSVREALCRGVPGDRQRLRRRRGALSAGARRAADRRSERSRGASREAAGVAARHGAAPFGGRAAVGGAAQPHVGRHGGEIAECVRRRHDVTRPCDVSVHRLRVPRWSRVSRCSSGPGACRLRVWNWRRGALLSQRRGTLCRSAAPVGLALPARDGWRHAADRGRDGIHHLDAVFRKRSLRAAND